MTRITATVFGIFVTHTCGFLTVVRDQLDLLDCLDWNVSEEYIQNT